MGLPVMALLAELGSQAVRAVGGAVIGRVSQSISGTPPGRYRSLGIMPSTLTAERPGDIPYVPDALEDLLGIGGGAEEYQNGNGQVDASCFELPTTVTAQYEQRVKCPDGYVSVGCGDARVCMLKPVARVLGKWKSRRKPPISASDWRRYKTAQRVEQKLLGIAKDAGIRSPSKKRSGRTDVRCK